MNDWKTTLAGAVAAGTQVFAHGLNLKSALVAFAMFLIGAFAKDTQKEG